MNTNNCGCKDITPCIQPLCIPTPCACPVLISSDCVNNVTIDLPCLNITKGKTLNAFLLAMDTAICAKFLAVQAYFRLISVGVGVGKIYKGINILGEKEIKSIKAGNLVTVTDLTNEVEIGVNQTALDLIIPTASNVGTGLGLVFKNKVLNVLNFRKVKTENTGVTGASVLKVEATDLVNDNVVISARKIKTDNSGTTGESILKTEIENTNDITISAKKINSESLMISTSVDTNTLNIEVIDSGIPQYIVNSDYTGLVEKGTIAKPYKNLQNALNAYVGTGSFTNKNPQNVGVQITVQKDINTFTGSLAYKGLKLTLKEGASMLFTPALSEYIIDLDAEAVLPAGMIPFSNTEQVNITIRRDIGSGIFTTKQGFKNRGTTTTAGLSQGKIIYLVGQGALNILADSSITSPSIRTLIEANKENLPGFFNDNNTANFGVEGLITTANTQLVVCGLNTKVYSDIVSVRYQFNNNAVGTYNSSTKPITISGGQMLVNNSIFESYNNASSTLNSFVSISEGSFVGAYLETIGSCNNVFENIGVSQPLLSISNSLMNFAQITFAKSVSVLWTNITLKNNVLSGTIPQTQIKLIPSSINTIDSKVVETLSEYSNRANAVANSLFKGCKFINTGGVVSPTTGWFIDIIV